VGWGERGEEGEGEEGEGEGRGKGEGCPWRGPLGGAGGVLVLGGGSGSGVNILLRMGQVSRTSDIEKHPHGKRDPPRPLQWQPINLRPGPLCLSSSSIISTSSTVKNIALPGLSWVHMGTHGYPQVPVYLGDHGVPITKTKVPMWGGGGTVGTPIKKSQGAHEYPGFQKGYP
jgi:hypothetical protein